MKSEKGSILMVTVAFIIVFTLFGISSIYHAGLQNSAAEKRRASEQAFWLADAAIEMAKVRLQREPPEIILPTDLTAVPLGDGTYDVYSEELYACPPDATTDCSTKPPECKCIDSWTAQSEAVVTNPGQGPQRRAIEVNIARYDIKNAITAHGTVNDDCTPAGSAEINGTCEQEVDFTFESVFNGTSKEDFEGQAIADGFKYIDPSNAGDVNPIENVTFVEMIVNHHINLDTANMPLDLVLDPTGNTVKAAFIIIDLSALPPSPLPQVHVDGNLDFRGIIWIIGYAQIKGTSDIAGTVFVDDDPPGDAKVSGDATVTYDKDAINQAMDGVGLDIFPGKPAIASWKEIQPPT
jgi:hypothetical protein